MNSPHGFQPPSEVLRRIFNRPHPLSWFKRSNWQFHTEAVTMAGTLSDETVRAPYPKAKAGGASSSAVITLASGVWAWIPMVLAAIVAVSSAYSIAVGLDIAASRMARLHYTWNTLAADYERLWNRWHEEDAEEIFIGLQRRGGEASETGSTEAPYDAQLLDKWHDVVNTRYSLTTA